MNGIWTSLGIAAAFAAASLTGAMAAPVTRAGEQIGLTPGYPLPEGIYAINTFTVGQDHRANAPTAMGNIPFLVWASPFRLFGARIQPVVSVPSVFVSPNNRAPVPNNDASVLYNPLVGSVFAWDLGGGFGVSYLLAAQLGVGDRGSLGLGFAGTPLLPQLASTTVRQSFAATYVGDGSYNITASLTYGLTVDPQARFGGPVGRALGPQAQADGLTLDLTATKAFGRFQFGPIAYMSTDLPVDRTQRLYQRYQRTGQLAVGGLVGYDFGRFILQAYVARDIVARETLDAFGQRQRNEETRGWFRVILPLYVADPALRAAALGR